MRLSIGPAIVALDQVPTLADLHQYQIPEDAAAGGSGPGLWPASLGQGAMAGAPALGGARCHSPSGASDLRVVTEAEVEAEAETDACACACNWEGYRQGRCWLPRLMIDEMNAD